MFRILFLMFILVPMIEIGLFMKVGGMLGFWPTITLIFMTALVGTALVRSQGMQTLMTLQSRLQQGEVPTQQIIESMLLAIAGFLLITPGFMTDIFGILLLLPAPRAWFAKKVMGKMVTTSYSSHTMGAFGDDPFRPQAGNTFEGEFERKDHSADENNRLN